MAARREERGEPRQRLRDAGPAVAADQRDAAESGAGGVAADMARLNHSAPRGDARPMPDRALGAAA